LWRTVSHERDLTLEQGKSVRSPHPEKEGAADTTCDELTTAPLPPVGDEVEKMGSEFEPEKKRGSCF